MAVYHYSAHNEDCVLLCDIPEACPFAVYVYVGYAQKKVATNIKHSLLELHGEPNLFTPSRTRRS